MKTTTPGNHRHTAAQAEYSKERTFESAFVLPVRTIRKSSKQSTGGKAHSGPSSHATAKNTTAREQPEKTGAGKTKRTTEERKELRRARELKPERIEARRQHLQARRQRAKELGICRDCKSPPVPGRLKCELCAEKHRGYRRKSAAAARARRDADRQVDK